MEGLSSTILGTWKVFSEVLDPAEEVWFSWQEPHDLAIALAEEMRVWGMRRVLDVGVEGGGISSTWLNRDSRSMAPTPRRLG